MKKDEYLKLIKKKPKYRNRKIEYDGYKFDSIAECERYKELKLMEKANLITLLRVHSVWVLIEKKPGIRRASYKSDFDYSQCGRNIIEDVKGKTAKLTAVFQIKRKLFKQRYGFDITIVRK